MIILGISAFFHDSAAALLIDGNIVAAAQEERFTRKKHDRSFPIEACNYCLSCFGLSIENIDTIVFYEKPLIKFERILETHIRYAPKGLATFIKTMPIWLKERFRMRSLIYKELKKKYGKGKCPPIKFIEHHLSHAALAYYTSPFEEASILVVDAVGEWATTSMLYGSGKQIKILKELHFPNSLGLLYSSFTQFLGFKVNSDEYKVMGMASYGNPDSQQTQKFVDIILSNLVTISSDGSFTLNDSYFTFQYGMKMIDVSVWEKLFNVNARIVDAKITQEHCNLAWAAQHVTARIMISLAKETKRCTGSNYLCIGGGTALNCSANGLILESKIFEDCYIPFDPGDSGGAIGSALAEYFSQVPQKDKCSVSPYLGPSFEKQIEDSLVKSGLKYQLYNENDLSDLVADYLATGNIIGWFQGRMEFGPRALGNRSILADPRPVDTKDKVNALIKFRESFRPFAPIVLEEYASSYFKTAGKKSPYMMFNFQVSESHRLDNVKDTVPLTEKISMPLSDIPAVTHIDYTSRIQTVNKIQNEKTYNLIISFYQKTGCPMLLNTSFNINGEPIVCSPFDAINTFKKSGIDYLVIGNYIINK